MAEQKQNNEIGHIKSREIVQEMRESYLDYAMSVIVARALPDVRDGLKPVHRRILYAMHEEGLTAGARFRKSASVIGSTLSKYHPHGDLAVYDALVRMAQDFSWRYPIIDGQGNFGSIDGDSPAAMRYTEVRMKEIAQELLRDLEKQASASIEFVGSVPSSEVQKHLLSARALVFPSIWYEGFGLTIVEAFAAGVPVLANNLGAMSSLVKPLGSDWLLEDRRSWPKALADLADSRRIAASGSLARKLYDKMYTGHANLLALEAAYARAVEEGP